MDEKKYPVTAADYRQHFHHTSQEIRTTLQAIQAQLTKQGEQLNKLMALADNINNAQTTLHADLENENGLIQQLLTAFATGAITPAQAQTVIDGMNKDDATAKSNITLLQAALGQPQA